MFTEQRARWLHENFRWLEENLSPRSPENPRVLVRPAPEFFPMRPTRNHAFALAVFEQTKALLDVSDWNCRLIPQSEEDREQIEALHRAGVSGELKHQGAAGTFSVRDEVEITYAPSLLDNPIALISTLAHELSHYLLADLEQEPPAGWAELEPLTDLTAVVEGFGIFLCNSAFSVGSWSDGLNQGWQYSRHGYLNEAELGFALAVFCVRTQTPPEIALPFLKPNPREVFRDALAFVDELEASSGP